VYTPEQHTQNKHKNPDMVGVPVLLAMNHCLKFSRSSLT
jgi:hypothetical protein